MRLTRCKVRDHINYPLVNRLNLAQGTDADSPLERVSNHLVSHCREIVLVRQVRNPGKLPDTVHCNHCTVRPGSGSAALARRQNPKRGLRRS